ncbi:MAG: 5'-nucleotidase [Prevotella sp.]|uniref:5'-nucleotidase n=1 Tax=Prevotella sp. TaxID=59823 RepID=UPI002A29ECCA|nr:5'-nucleotidase [Prevotella sp.]MDD7317196.1 5'-nucleotidase [Prevotellaceae bacterium]MDY4019800.1 5'-nucleotidase [Prevotella sp.]
MRKKTLIFVFIAAFVLSACGSQYKLSSVSWTRLLIDKRYDANPDEQAAAFMVPYKKMVDSVMSPVVGATARYLERGRPEGLLSNLLPDIFMAMAHEYGETPDFATYNYGGIRAALPAGTVTKGDINDVAPFENKIVFVTLKGDKVLELFQQMLNRGGECVSHEVRMVADKNYKLLSATVGGEPVDPNRNYRITTIDYVQQGNDDLTAFKSGTNLNSPGGDEANSRNVIMRYVQSMTEQGKKIDSALEGRITINN